jgi:hypothetical protein
VLAASSLSVFLVTFELHGAAAIGGFGLRERISPAEKERVEDGKGEQQRQ